MATAPDGLVTTDRGTGNGQRAIVFILFTTYVLSIRAVLSPLYRIHIVISARFAPVFNKGSHLYLLGTPTLIL